MKRLASISLIVCFAVLGTRSLSYLHDLDHRHQDAAHATEAEEAAGLPDPHHHHDASSCDLHAQLQLPLISAAWVPLLICLGVLVAFLTLLPASFVGHRPTARLRCRGPPAC